MKTLPTAARLRELLSYDPETGVFTRRVTVGGQVAGSTAGTPHEGYIRVRVDGQAFAAHRLAWLYMTGEAPTGLIDHEHSDGTDNRFAKLRTATYATNNQNKRRASNRLGLLGVGRTRSGRFDAQIWEPGKSNRHLGTFDTPELAHAAYLAAKRELHPGNTL